MSGKRTTFESNWDVIVIGSGAGGLTAAVALANAGKRVLVLEQHYMAGGWTHSFVLDGYRYSPGVHYIGELGEGGMMRKAYEGLGISGDLEFCEMNPDGYEHLLIAGQRFDVPAGRENYRSRLKARFPHEAKGIDAVFDKLIAVNAQLQMLDAKHKPKDLLKLPWRMRDLLMTGARPISWLLDKHLGDPVVKANIAAIAGDYGIGPSKGAVAMHAALMSHYFSGAWYPRGGSYRIPRAYIRQLKRRGGTIRLSTPVDRILLRDGQAVGVRTAEGEELYADIIVSNADPNVTFKKLLDADQVPEKVQRKLQKTKWSLSSLGLFLATDMDLAALGFDSGNYWYYKTPDVDAAYSMTPEQLHHIATTPGAEFDCAFLTVTTLKDPSKRKDGHHTLEVFAFIPWEPFEKWSEHTSGDEEPADYVAFKDAIGQALLRTANRVIPGLSDNLKLCEVGSPLTNAYYCAGHQGHVYGPEKSRSQLGPLAWPVKSAIPNLFMVGAATISHGVAGVTMSGVIAAASILGVSPKAVLNQKGAPLVTYPSEHPEQWIDSLRKRRNRGAARQSSLSASP